MIAATWLLGIPAAISLNVLKNQDFVWGYALIISGVLIALAVMRYGARRLRIEELASDPNDWRLGRWWDLVMMGFIPAGGIGLVVWWLVMGAVPGRWYNPLDPSSVMNCLLQWAVALAVMLVIGRRLARRTLERNFASED